MKKLPLTTIILIVLAAFLLWDDMKEGYKFRSNDYVGYWTSTQYISRFGGGDFYSESGRARLNFFYKDPNNAVDPAGVKAIATRFSPIEITQTPFLFAATAPLTGGDFLPGMGLFGVFAALSFAAASFLLMRAARYDVDTSLALFALISFSFVPLISEMENLNINRFLLLFFALGLWSLSRGNDKGRFMAGFWLAAGVFFKPITILVPGFLVLSRVLRKRWRELKVEAAGGAAGAAFCLVTGALYFGYPGVWLDWFSYVGNFSARFSPFTSYNLSLPAMLLEVTGKDLALPVLAAGLLFTGYRAVRLILLQKKTEKGPEAGFVDDLQIASLGLGAYLLSTRLAWYHYYVLALPMVFVLLGPSWRKGEKWPLTAASLAAFLAMTELPDRIKGGIPPPMVSFALIWGAALVLFVLCSRRPASSGEPQAGR